MPNDSTIPACASDLDYECDCDLPALVDQAARTVRRIAGQRLQDCGLSWSSWRVLEVLAERGSLSMKELCEAQATSKSTMSRLVKRLYEDDLVRRHDDADDRRIRVVSLTARGHALVQELETADTESERLREQLSRPACVRVRHGLELLNRALELLESTDEEVDASL